MPIDVGTGTSLHVGHEAQRRMRFRHAASSQPLPACNIAGVILTGRPARATTKQVTVWHDGTCPLCRREIAAMRRLDRRDAIDFVDVSGATCPIDRDGMRARFRTREDVGPLLSGDGGRGHDVASNPDVAAAG